MRKVEIEERTGWVEVHLTVEPSSPSTTREQITAAIEAALAAAWRAYGIEPKP
jgi:hypothetical protein